MERRVSCVIECITIRAMHANARAEEIPLNAAVGVVALFPISRQKVTAIGAADGEEVGYQRHRANECILRGNYSMQIALFPPRRITTDRNVFRRGDLRGSAE